MYAKWENGILKIAEKDSRKSFQRPVGKLFLSAFVDAVKKALVAEYADEWICFFTEEMALDFTTMNDAVRGVIRAELIRLEALAEATAVDRHEVDCVISNPVVHAITDAVVPVLTEVAHEIQAEAVKAAAEAAEAA